MILSRSANRFPDAGRSTPAHRFKSAPQNDAPVNHVARLSEHNLRPIELDGVLRLGDRQRSIAPSSKDSGRRSGRAMCAWRKGAPERPIDPILRVTIWHLRRFERSVFADLSLVTCYFQIGIPART